ncbi:MAG: L-sorbosone dehydrogenase [Bacteroidetes bacterium]|nr:L-sorbosone dehydrogenase [Bacteroidota bacterium]
MLRQCLSPALVGALLALTSASTVRAAPPRPAGLERIILPAGFTIDVFADDVEQARSLALGPKGTVFVGSLSRGTVTALIDRDGDGKADEAIVVAEDLNTPNGVAVRDGALYVAEINRVLRFDAIEENLRTPPKPVVVNDSFPKDKSHGWKFIAFGPDGKLYVPVGAP